MRSDGNGIGAWGRLSRQRSTALFASLAILLLGFNEDVLAHAMRGERCGRYLLVCLCLLLAIRGVSADHEDAGLLIMRTQTDLAADTF